MMALRVEKLTKAFQESQVFSEISFHIAQGEFATFLGPSGCGKSTLLRCIAGLTTPDSGEIFINENNITSEPPRLRGIAMVFQSYALFPNMTVWDNIGFGLKMKKLPVTQQSSLIEEVIALVELQGKEQKYPAELSGGQCQRVALARSLVLKPKILLMDEPFSALDTRIRKKLRVQLRTIQKELNLTALFVTHDQEEALTISDRILLMNEGKIVQDGTAEQIYTEPSNSFAVRFIGNYNLLDNHQARTLLGITSDHQIAVRPESIYVREDGRNYPEHVRHPVKGKVMDSLLLGNVIRYRVEVAGLELKVDLLNRSSERLFATGAELQLLFNAQEIREVD
ncbi:ABC transporter ATP-binding protein [Endozoicomonas sp. OPT23]|uniref:ABC transporter ATP-binding protein n=1 Tax=Endozoicomonas sp. OPT23 TaxID=2072845 RepID=UPI00129BB2A7|nr:ABC transporter ATP-binding protein [Endozoicomonas sp. OPT23]MRI31488.1 ABC transporter ATP-binding protein [Endozoicomonas sp. OPT23]